MIYSIKYKLSEIEKVSKLLIDKADKVSLILLIGETGAGKTTIVKSILKSFGIDENITSPTFSIVNQYFFSKQTINHFDLYRIKNSKELDAIGFDEYIENGDISFIEWPELAMDKFNCSFLEIHFKYIDEKTREITLKKN
tara:strand:+ start:19156 stop:19575 length:420 start_codon:yes stop_codon:yes gene_type:complete